MPPSTSSAMWASSLRVASPSFVATVMSGSSTMPKKPSIGARRSAGAVAGRAGGAALVAATFPSALVAAILAVSVLGGLLVFRR
eukprot:SAG31_NODE_289_length_18388_cov_7.110504_1_plen_84_part_00